MKDCFQNWWLIMRCSWIGGGIGSIPGISASVVDWLAYGHALKTEKGAAQTFGKGDVRGVIASESSNNAKEGGALVPTIAFGVPGRATMAILLGAFLIHGLVPGPDMLTKNLNITYSMVWSVALANILGAGICYAFSPQFARLATLRYTLILPAVLGIIYIGAFEASRQWGDLFALLFFGLVGWIMKQFKWPRPPLILGVVLGDTIERYMFISVERYGVSWLLRPVVVILFTHGDHRPAAAVPAGHPQATAASRKYGDELPGADVPPVAAVHDVHDRADRRRGRGRDAVGLQRQDRAAGGRQRGLTGRLRQPVQRHVPQADAPAAEGLAEQAQHEVGRTHPHGPDLRHRASAGAR